MSNSSQDKDSDSEYEDDIDSKRSSASVTPDQKQETMFLDQMTQMTAVLQEDSDSAASQNTLMRYAACEELIDSFNTSSAAFYFQSPEAR